VASAEQRCHKKRAFVGSLAAPASGMHVTPGVDLPLPIATPTSGSKTLAEVRAQRRAAKSLDFFHNVRAAAEEVAAAVKGSCNPRAALLSDGILKLAALALSAGMQFASPEASLLCMDERAAVLAAPLFGVSERKLTRARQRIAAGVSIIGRRGIFVRPHLADYADVRDLTREFMGRVYSLAELHALKYMGELPDITRREAGERYMLRADSEHLAVYLNVLPKGAELIAQWRRDAAGSSRVELDVEEEPPDDEEAQLDSESEDGSTRSPSAPDDNSGDEALRRPQRLGYGDSSDDSSTESEEDEDGDDDDEASGDDDGDSGSSAPAAARVSPAGSGSGSDGDIDASLGVKELNAGLGAPAGIVLQPAELGSAADVGKGQRQPIFMPDADVDTGFRPIGPRTAQRLLAAIGWTRRAAGGSTFKDEHERADVVVARTERYERLRRHTGEYITVWSADVKTMLDKREPSDEWTAAELKMMGLGPSAMPRLRVSEDEACLHTNDTDRRWAYRPREGEERIVETQPPKSMGGLMMICGAFSGFGAEAGMVMGAGGGKFGYFTAERA
jgi:hypothetical protein